MSLEKAKTAAKNVLERLSREFTHYPAIRDFVDRELKLIAAEAEEIFGVAEAPTLPPQPPVDNDHVAEGCEKFSEETIAANANPSGSTAPVMGEPENPGSGSWNAEDDEAAEDEGESQPDTGSANAV